MPRKELDETPTIDSISPGESEERPIEELPIEELPEQTAPLSAKASKYQTGGK